MCLSMRTNKGFTLIEVIVVMVVFVVVIAIAASALQTMLNKGGIVLKSEESNIEGVIGLEMFRHDLAQAGFGLFTDPDSVPTFAEATGVPAATYNDASAVPRAIVTGNDLTLGNNAIVLTGTDYMAIKATTVARNATAQQWTYINDAGVPHQWGLNDLSNNTNKLIVMSLSYSKSLKEVVKTLKQISANNYAISYDAAGGFRDIDGNFTDFYTPTSGKLHYLYGIGTDSVAFTLRAPFNRADYYVRRVANETPAVCSPATGVLYKMNMSHANGAMTPPLPMLDCVADMQIILGWNTQADPVTSNSIDAFSDASGQNTTGVTNGLNLSSIMQDATELRKRLRQIKVYLLAQDGPQDRNFSNTNTMFVLGDTNLGETPLTSTIDLTTPNMVNYRWKMYRIVVRPRNI